MYTLLIFARVSRSSIPVVAMSIFVAPVGRGAADVLVTFIHRVWNEVETDDWFIITSLDKTPVVGTCVVVIAIRIEDTAIDLDTPSTELLIAAHVRIPAIIIFDTFDEGPIDAAEMRRTFLSRPLLVIVTFEFDAEGTDFLFRETLFVSIARMMIAALLVIRARERGGDADTVETLVRVTRCTVAALGVGRAGSEIRSEGVRGTDSVC